MGSKNLSELEAEQGEKKLYITEWFERLGCKDQVVAKRVGVSRETVFRWRKEPHRMNPPKLRILSLALGIEPQDFWFHPDEPSLDYRVRSLGVRRRKQIRQAISGLLSNDAIFR